MISRATIACLLALTLFACGVKNDLDIPPGAMADERQRQVDPSRPPVPLGQQ